MSAKKVFSPTENQKSRIMYGFFSGIMGVFLAFCLIASQRWILQNAEILASVTRWMKPQDVQVEYQADIVFQKNTQGYVMIAGNEFHKVDAVEGIILQNNDQKDSVPHIDNADIFALGDGMYRFSVGVSSQNLYPGQNITTLSISSDTSFQVYDMQFVSEGKRYNLTSLIE